MKLGAGIEEPGASSEQIFIEAVVVELMEHKLHEKLEKYDHLLYVPGLFFLLLLRTMDKILVVSMIWQLVRIREFLDYAVAQVIVDVLFEQRIPSVAETIFVNDFYLKFLLKSLKVIEVGLLLLDPVAIFFDVPYALIKLLDVHCFNRLTTRIGATSSDVTSSGSCFSVSIISDTSFVATSEICDLNLFWLV